MYKEGGGETFLKEKLLLNIKLYSTRLFIVNIYDYLHNPFQNLKQARFNDKMKQKL